MIIFIHDISDFFLFLGRICNDFKIKINFFFVSVMALTLISWFFCRLICLPYTILPGVGEYAFMNLYNEN